MATGVIDGAYDITLKSDPRRYRAFLIDADVPTLLDAGSPDTTDVLFDGIDEVGLEPERVIVTHEDHHHVGGSEEVVGTYDVECWAPADDADVIAEDYGVGVDRRYEHGDHIGPYEVVHVPGHTPGASVLVHAEADYAVLGDVLWGPTSEGSRPATSSRRRRGTPTTRRRPS